MDCVDSRLSARWYRIAHDFLEKQVLDSSDIRKDAASCDAFPASRNLQPAPGKGRFVKSRKQEILLSVGICLGAALLVTWIRGAFDLEAWHTGDSKQRSAMVGTGMARELFPGIVVPPVASAESTTIRDDADIVGLEVNGRHRAYCLSEMDSPSTHVINDLIDHIPVTVTYCNITRCVRVFTKPEDPDKPLNVSVRGFADGQMVIHIDQKDFGHDSAEIPLKELAFERTAWGAWKSAYPDTDVCTGLHEIAYRQWRPGAPTNRDSAGDTSHAGE
jgi:hypothetical protein